MMQPLLDRPSSISFNLRGRIGRYIQRVTDNWLKTVPEANPAILEMFRDRDRLPRRRLMIHSGEFAGKYLTGAVQVLRLTRDSGLYHLLSDFVHELIANQDEDGYLGPFPRATRLENRLPEGETNYHNGQTWDTWGHYHTMLGLLLWHEESGDPEALAAVCKIADLICKRFLGAEVGRRLVDTGLPDRWGWNGTYANLAPIHSLCLLYHKVPERRYLSMAQQIADEFAAEGAEGPLASNYIKNALAGKEFYEFPFPRWEGLHSVMGVVELYWLTGREEYRQAFEGIWWSLVKLERHNNGGFSSDEWARGNPYHQGTIETCCTIAWVALCVEMLRLTGNSVIADEIELSTLNSVVGLHSASGRWTTYNTPMDGERHAFVQDHNWQCQAGSPELNCCSVNSARGFGLISDWALMHTDTGLALNYYGNGEIVTQLSSGQRITLKQDTEYPCDGRIKIEVGSEARTHFALHLRIPYWSQSTRLCLDGESLKGVTPGAYFSLEREWHGYHQIVLELDMSYHFWVGEQECTGKTSIYRGPILLTCDLHDNLFTWDNLPELDASRMNGRMVTYRGLCPPLYLIEFEASNGQPIYIRDFGSAGEAGMPYRSWLSVRNVPQAEFSKTNPLRSARP
jgi:DUF1680 family protein